MVRSRAGSRSTAWRSRAWSCLAATCAKALSSSPRLPSSASSTCTKACAWARVRGTPRRARCDSSVDSSRPSFMRRVSSARSAAGQVVLGAQGVEDRSLDARAGVGLEGDRARGVEAIDRVDETEHAGADQIVQVHARGHPAGQPEREVARQTGVGADESFALLGLHRLLPGSRLAPHRVLQRRLVQRCGWTRATGVPGVGWDGGAVENPGLSPPPGRTTGRCAMWDGVIRLTLRRLLDGVDLRGGVVEGMRVLFVDDERDLVSSLSRYFRLHGFETSGAFGVAEAVERLAEARSASKRFDAVVTDLRMPDGDGLVVLGEVRRLLPGTPVLVMTAFGSVATSVEAMRLGAVTMLEKPVPIAQLEREVRDAIAGALEVEGGLEAAGGAGLVGTSQAIRDVFDTLVRVAPSNSSVLIQGES